LQALLIVAWWRRRFGIAAFFGVFKNWPETKLFKHPEEGSDAEMSVSLCGNRRRL